MNMDGLMQNGYVNSAVNEYQNRKNDVVKEGKAARTESAGSSKLNDVGGRTIGDPKLSDKALKYYEQLKKKYSNMDFILVSPDKKQEAESRKGMYGSSKELIVLIDSDKIEQMAEDEAYRKKYEAILSGATAQMAQMKSSLGSNADKVSAFGMTFDDYGNASFFAVVDKSLALQRERISAKHEENIQKKKQEAKKAEKKRDAERLAEKAEKRAEEKKATLEPAGREKDKVTVTADSFEELVKKIDDVVMSYMADNLFTEAELKVGQNIDFSL